MARAPCRWCFSRPPIPATKRNSSPETPLIITARVQLAEAWEGGGAQVVLVGEQVLPYQMERVEPDLDLTVRKRREPAAAGAPKKARPTPIPPSTAPPASATPAPRPAAPPPRRRRPAGGRPRRRSGGDYPPTAVRRAGRRDAHAPAQRDPGPPPGAARRAALLPRRPAVGGPTFMPVKRTVAASPEFCAEVEALLGAGCYELRSSGG